MRKTELVHLLQAIRQSYSGDINIVGSQAAYAVSITPPQIVTQSLEGDILLNESPADSHLKEAFGPFSKYQREHEIALDVLTERSVTLPSGWMHRRVPIKDLDRVAMPGIYAAEIHDVACAKLAAGREKDFVFLTEFHRSLDIKLSTLADRVRLVEDHYRYHVIPERTMKWGHFMEEKKFRTEAVNVFALGKELLKESLRQNQLNDARKLIKEGREHISKEGQGPSLSP